MSNRRRLRGAAAVKVRDRCSGCGGRVGKLADALRLRTGQVICPRCRQSGQLPRAGCGHIVLPGSFTVVNDGGDGGSRCPACAPAAAAAAGIRRLGMAPRQEAGRLCGCRC